MLPKTISDAVCPACCCLCDDIALTVQDGRVVEVANACHRGRAWFLAAPEIPAASAAASVDAAPVTLERAVAAAAQLLRTARYPLVYILPEMASEAQRLAIGIADWLDAVVDTATSGGHGPSIMGFQNAGKVTCTLGETRNRANLIVFWGTNVVATYPRFFTRYSAEATGMFVPRGRADRTCVAIDVGENETTRSVDQSFIIKPNTDFEVLNTLRALVAGVRLDPDEIQHQTGVPLAAWTELAEQMKQARFGSIVFGRGLMHSRGRQANCEALFRLVAELNDHTRFICRSIRASGNVTGGDKTMTWRTGFPFGVNLARGYPRYNPGEYTADEVLARGEADAALIVGGVASERLTPPAVAHLAQIPVVHIASRHEPLVSSTRQGPAAARITIPTAKHGLHSAGTMYRMDDIPIRTRAVLPSPLPSESDVLRMLEIRLRSV